MRRIFYQGAPGSFSDSAARGYFGDSERVGVATFSELFEALEKDVCAVVPIENSLIGPIYENDDLLIKSDASIIGEYYLRIEHCLLGNKGATIQGLKKVFSHPKALEQCRLFFKAHPWIEPVIHYDTAGASSEIAASQECSHGAIASECTAELYGLKVLQKNVEDNPQNYTRFIILRKGACEEEADKCSMVFSLKHEPGALHAILSQFASEKINLTRIASRPIVGHPFEYLFYLDCEFDPGEKVRIESLLKRIRERADFFKVFGFYKRDCL